MIKFCAAGLVTAMMLISGPAYSASVAHGFLPHRAVYDLSLKEASDRSGIRSMRGRIVYELTGSVCEGFAARYRFSTKVHIGGKELLNDQRSTTFESADGKRFDFISQYYLNGQKEQDLRGSATRGDAGVKVNITKPDEREVDLEDAIFMNQHLVKIIENAQAGETFLTAKVFDGSEEGDQLVDTTSIIGKMKPPLRDVEGEPETVTKMLSEKSAWPVSVSYYTDSVIEGGGERLPSYQVSFLLHEDGVTRNLTMRYEDYSMKGILKNIEYLPATPCSE